MQLGELVVHNILFSFISICIPYNIFTLNNSILKDDPLYSYCNEYDKFSLTQMRIQVNIFTWRRELSLRRLLSSLASLKDVDIMLSMHIFIDGGSTQEVDQLAENFQWPFGPKMITKRTSNFGLPACVLKSWNPLSTEEWGVFLEDDIEVSPHLIDWIHYCIKNTKDLHKIAGCSFYTPRVDEISMKGDPENPTKINFASEEEMFLLQLPSSWGAIYKASTWLQFLQFYEWRQSLGFPILLPELRSNEWKLSWKRHFIDFMIYHGYAVLYPNFKDQQSFSTNHYEEGVHSVPEGHEIIVRNFLKGFIDERFTVPLIKNKNVYEKALKKNVENLDVFDVFHEESSWSELQEQSQRLKLHFTL